MKVHPLGQLESVRLKLPGTVARSDVHPSGMQMVSGLILLSGNILSRRLIMK